MGLKKDFNELTSGIKYDWNQIKHEIGIGLIDIKDCFFVIIEDKVISFRHCITTILNKILMRTLWAEKTSENNGMYLEDYINEFLLYPVILFMSLLKIILKKLYNQESKRVKKKKKKFDNIFDNLIKNVQNQITKKNDMISAEFFINSIREYKILENKLRNENKLIKTYADNSMDNLENIIREIKKAKKNETNTEKGNIMFLNKIFDKVKSEYLEK